VLIANADKSCQIRADGVGENGDARETINAGIFLVL
jgi:hypothetical protein